MKGHINQISNCFLNNVFKKRVLSFGSIKSNSKILTVVLVSFSSLVSAGNRPVYSYYYYEVLPAQRQTHEDLIEYDTLI